MREVKTKHKLSTAVWPLAMTLAHNSSLAKVKVDPNAKMKVKQVNQWIHRLTDQPYQIYFECRLHIQVIP